MVTVLHVVLFKTADLDYSTRERATHLLQILDRRCTILLLCYMYMHAIVIHVHAHVHARMKGIDLQRVKTVYGIFNKSSSFLLS